MKSAGHYALAAVAGLLVIGAIGQTTSPSQHPAPPPAASHLSPKTEAAAVGMIRALGYDCQSVSSSRVIGMETLRVRCNDYRYTFDIENHGGKWRVVPP